MSKTAAMSRWRWVWQGALALALSLPSRAGAVSPVPVDWGAQVLVAERYAAQAFEAYGKKEYAQAIALYRKAHDTAPSADALYNIARVYDLGLRARPLAIAAYREFLADPGATPDRIKGVSERVRALGVAERAARQANPGVQKVAPATTLVRARVPTEDDDPQSSTQGRKLDLPGLVCGATGILSLGTGIGFGLSAMADADTANASCVGNRCSSQRGMDAAKAAANKASVATVSISAGVLLMATGATLWLLDSGGSSEHEAPPSVQVTPVASGSELGMAMSGSW
jgi:tetratricopeptide (TPR) repeat protein